jgi:hypothetical protein
MGGGVGLAGFNGEGVGMDTGWVKGIENVVNGGWV